jgi:hypothetical protein
MKTIYHIILTVIIALFCVTSVHAAYPGAIWQKGYVLLWNQTALEGELTYNWSAEMVSFRQEDGRISTFSANQVSRFGWFDYSQHKHRSFLSITQPVNKDREGQVFFEVCMDGQLPVVRRLRKSRGLLKRAFSHPTYSADRPVMAQNTDLFDYYVFDDGQLLALDRFHVEIYEPLMKSYDQEIRRYVTTHNINDRSTSGQLVIIDHYNWLAKQNARTASAKGLTGVQE